MTRHNPFTPPVAAVTDIPAGRTLPRGPVIALVCAGLVPLAWLALRMPGYIELVSSNAMNPLVMLLALAGMLCFAVGLVRAFPRGLRGRKSFGTAIALVLLPLATMGTLVYPVYALAIVFAPFLLATVVALAGFVLVGTRKRSAGQQA